MINKISPILYVIFFNNLDKFGMTATVKTHGIWQPLPENARLWGSGWNQRENLFTRTGSLNGRDTLSIWITQLSNPTRKRWKLLQPGALVKLSLIQRHMTLNEPHRCRCDGTGINIGGTGAMLVFLDK